MFGIGPVEFVVLLVIAVIVFGPERLPEAMKKAAHLIRQLRRMADNARNDLSDELGPEFRDLDLNDLRNPRRAVQKYVLDGVDEDDVRVDRDLDIRKDLDLRKDLDELDTEDEDSRRSSNGRSGKNSRDGRRDGARTPESDTSDGSDDESSDDENAGTSGTSGPTGTPDGSAAVGTVSSEKDDAESDPEESGEDRTTLTLTENERPPFDPDAT